MIRSITITSASHHLYPIFRSVYSTSFPIFEQRTYEQQQDAFADNRYRLDAYTSAEGELIGFISYWTFPKYVYVEHFAISPQHRGMGKGTIILRQFIANVKATRRVVILEIDPPVDAVSISRQHFYERQGMTLNIFDHHHPPYRDGFNAHALRIMSSGGNASTEEYEIFSRDLQDIVMKRKLD